MSNKKLNIEMKDIKDLIQIVTYYTRKNLPLVDLKTQFPNGNKELNLFLGLKNKEFHTDEEASKGIYGSPKVDFKFRMLKSRLNRKLLNHLFFIDYSTLRFPRSTVLRQECQDYLFFARTLHTVGQIKQAEKLYIKSLEIARECEFTDLAMEGLIKLRDLYATLYRPKLFRNIQQQLEEIKTKSGKEEEADAAYYEAKLKLNATINNRKKDLRYLKDTVEFLKGKAGEVKSYNIYEKYFTLKLKLFELRGDFKSLLEYAGQLENEYKSGLINNNRFDPPVTCIAKLKAFLKLKRFDEGLKLAGAELKNMGGEQRFWLEISEYLLLMLLNIKDFNRASTVIQKVLESKALAHKDETIKYKWDIYRGYAFYLTKDPGLIHNFDYRSFTTQTPPYKKEMAGLHTAHLFLQILVNLNGEPTVLHEKLSAINDYTGKYLNNSFSKRTKIFYKLLQKVIVHNRAHEDITVKSKYLEDKLRKTPSPPDVYADVEVVPYEYLWEHICITVMGNSHGTLKKLTV